MPKATRVHSTPPTNTPTALSIGLPVCDAGSVSRHQMAKDVHNPDALKDGHGVPTLRKGTQIVRTLEQEGTCQARTHQQGVRNSAQDPKGMYAAHTLAGAAKGTCAASILSAQPDGRQLADLLWLRQVAADTIERLIAFLDDTDDFTMHELEADPADDEPALGWTRAGALGNHSDLEINEVVA